MGARYELGATSQRSGFRRGNQEGLMTWRDRSKLSFSLTILGLMTSCLLSRWVLLPDVTSSLSGIRVCLFELARISKIIRCFINLFYLAVQTKLVPSLTRSWNWQNSILCPCWCCCCRYLGKTPRISWRETRPLVVTRSCWSNIMLRSCMSDVFWELVTFLGLCQSEHCDDVEFLSFTKWVIV